MKTKQCFTLALAAMITVSLAVSVWGKPPKMKFVNVSGKLNCTIHRSDYGIWEKINEVVQAEPSDGQDPEILGLLESIGIK